MGTSAGINRHTHAVVKQTTNCNVTTESTEVDAVGSWCSVPSSFGASLEALAHDNYNHHDV